MADTYVDPSDHARERQRTGAATKTARALRDWLPNVLQALADRKANRQPLTLRACAKAVPHYSAFLGHRYRHEQLLALAEEVSPSKA